MDDLLEPGVLRVRAPNPSPMTERGTNTYLVGEDALAVIDPGPDDAGHRARLIEATRGRPVAAVIVTHAHLDHSAGARALADAVRAPLLAFGPPDAGRSDVMQRLVAEGLAGGGEGVDTDFRPDRAIGDGDSLELCGERLEVLWTPGHFAGHICIAHRGALFTGDHVMDWASSIVSPPDGDLSQFMASCEALLQRRDRRFFPGHGAPVDDPRGRLEWLLAHRREREREILRHLAHGAATVEALSRSIYVDIPPPLHFAARRNVFAHLIDLQARSVVIAVPRLDLAATFRLA